RLGDRVPELVRYAEVVLPLPVAHPYTYGIPDGLAARAVPGARVVVPLRRRRVVALVTAVDVPPPSVAARPILDAPDPEPALPPAPGAHGGPAAGRGPDPRRAAGCARAGARRHGLGEDPGLSRSAAERRGVRAWRHSARPGDRADAADGGTGAGSVRRPGGRPAFGALGRRAGGRVARAAPRGAPRGGGPPLRGVRTGPAARGDRRGRGARAE